LKLAKDGVVWAWIAETARICAATAIFMMFFIMIDFSGLFGVIYSGGEFILHESILLP
jgi:hypothetical protein